MPAVPLAHRAHYRHVWAVDWKRLMAASLVALAPALGLGLLQFCAWRYVGYHWSFAVLFAAAAAFVSARAIRASHCRNPVVGLLIALALGAVAFLSQFYFGMVFSYGPRAILRVDLLPQFIDGWVHSLVWALNPREHQLPMPEEVRMNWLLVALGVVCTVVGAFIASGVAAQRPYSQTGRRWLKSCSTILPEARGVDFLAAMESGDFSAVGALPRVTAGVETSAGLMSLKIEYCPVGEGEAAVPAYMTLANVFNLPFGNYNRIELAPEEFSQLLPLLPELAEAIREADPWEVNGLAPLTPPGVEASGSLASNNPIGEVVPPVEVSAVPAAEAGLIRTPWSRFIANALEGLGAFAFIWIILVFVMAFALDDGDPRPARETVRGTILVGCLMGGLMFGLVILTWGFKLGPVLARRFWQRRVRRAIARRARATVDPRLASAVLVHVVPRRYWSKSRSASEVDIGLLFCDRERQELRFEGDLERYRIPAGAITTINIEPMTGIDGYHVLVLRAQAAGRLWELVVVPDLPVSQPDFLARDLLKGYLAGMAISARRSNRTRACAGALWSQIDMFLVATGHRDR